MGVIVQLLDCTVLLHIFLQAMKGKKKNPTYYDLSTYLPTLDKS